MYMKYTYFGKTNKQVSVVGFGGLRFNLAKSNEENAKLVTYAYDKGINYFDTAPGYCDGRSEEIFGVAFEKLKKEGKDKFYVSTKGRPTVFDTAEKAIAGVKKSIERMGVSKIDFYHIWCIRKMEHYKLAMREGGMYEGLLKCKEQGLIDHICFSSHQPGDEVIQILKENKFEGVTMGINILNFSYRWNGVKYAYENGYGVVAMNPLSGGSIPDHEKELSFIAGERETAVEAALRFNISSPQITVSLVGFANTGDIDMACRIADEAKTFTEEDIEKIKEKVGKNMNSICTACGYCRVCPQEINIPGYMLFYNEKQMFNKTDEEMIELVYGLEYWNYAANSPKTAKDCIKCGKCQEECTQHLPIIERLQEIDYWEKKGTNNVNV